MKIDRKKLEEVIKKVLEEINVNKDNKRVFIVFSYPWNNLYYLALEELKKLNFPLNAIISENISGNYLKDIETSLDWESISVFNNETKLELSDSRVIFLRLSRNNIIDIANMYGKNFETNLVKDLLAEGKNIFYWNKGLEKITGKEPSVYQDRLLKYYREIFEFGIYPIELKAVKE